MKRCPKCGRTYDDIWQVCLEDGEPVIDNSAIPRSPEFENLKNKAQKQTVQERRREISALIKMGLFCAIIAFLIVYKTSGNPFGENAGFAAGVLEKIMYNAGTIVGIIVIGIFFAVPVWFIWKLLKDKHTV